MSFWGLSGVFRHSDAEGVHLLSAMIGILKRIKTCAALSALSCRVQATANYLADYGPYNYDRDCLEAEPGEGAYDKYSGNRQVDI